MAIKLIAFDVDGTLIDDGSGQINIWQQIHRRFGLPDEENDRRFDQFHRGEITYAQWVDLDVGGWKALGVTRDMLFAAVSGLRLMPGARETVFELARRGYRLCVISGSIDLGLEILFPGHPFRPVFINRIHFGRDGRISHWEATPFDLVHKAQALRDVARQEGLAEEECAFVGDNTNDVEVARAAGYSISFNSKSADLDAVSDRIIRVKDLKMILSDFPMLR
ncbi:MAG: HAD family phosphatase [Planctomycetes bacterium]|nr:HAD family phosphatase [Planctomycetota bacterium]